VETALDADAGGADNGHGSTMIRKSTLVILVLALALGGGVYWYQSKHATPETSADTSKPAFSGVQAADIQSITLQHPPATEPDGIQIERQSGAWQITRPVATPADDSSVSGIADGIAGARVSQTEPGAPDRLKAFGLQPGAISIDFKLKNGTSHRILLGDKDFTAENVYALLDSSADVSLLPVSLLTSADKGLADLRDKTDLHLNADTAATVDLKNASGEVTMKKDADGNSWSLVKPESVEADADTVSALVSALASGKMKSVASETPDHLEKYGLASPPISVTVGDGVGKTSTLIVGKKDGDDYFARDTARPTIFKIDADLYKKLTATAGLLRDKSPLRVEESDLNEIELHDANGAMSATRKSADEWVMASPDAVKGKTAGAWKVLSPVSDLRAEEVIEKPSSDVLAKLKDPAYEITFTNKAGKKMTLRISKEAGDFVYAQSSENPAVYKLKKQSVNDLNLKPADFASTT
jgi:hypothetical protein